MCELMHVHDVYTCDCRYRDVHVVYALRVKTKLIRDVFTALAVIQGRLQLTGQLFTRSGYRHENNFLTDTHNVAYNEQVTCL